MNRIELDAPSREEQETMSGSLNFVNVLHLDADEVIIDFSDGTSARFSASQLAALQPVRERWNCEEE